jgi:hypothetical protein
MGGRQEHDENPVEQAAADVARLLAGMPNLRRAVEVADDVAADLVGAEQRQPRRNLIREALVMLRRGEVRWAPDSRG